jgi:hypothetical protein
MRTKNIRSVPGRWAIVAVVTAGLFWPGRAASHGLNASMCRRVTWDRQLICGAVAARKPAKQRSAMSAFTTLRGRSTHPICSR